MIPPHNRNKLRSPQEVSKTLCRKTLNSWFRLVGFIVVSSFCSCLADRAEESPGTDETAEGLVRILNQRELCRCFFGDNPYMTDTSAVIECFDDRIRLAGLTYDSIKLEESKQAIVADILVDGKSLRFGTSFKDCVRSLDISMRSTVMRIPDNPDDRMFAKAFDERLTSIIHGYVLRNRPDTEEWYVPIWPNERPRLTQTLFMVNGNDIIDSVVYSEHNLDDIRKINQMLMDTLQYHLTVRDSGLFVITAFYYENDQVKIFEIE